MSLTTKRGAQDILQLPGTAKSERSIRVGDTWNTPRWIGTLLHVAYAGTGGLVLDPCSNPTSLLEPKLALSLETGHDGLRSDWYALVGSGSGLVFVNPPYSNPKPWLLKCAEEARKGAHVVALVKADPSTSAWREAVWPWCVAVGFTKRLCFREPNSPWGRRPPSAPFPTAFVCWGHTPPPVFRDEPKIEWVVPMQREHLAVEESMCKPVPESVRKGRW